MCVREKREREKQKHDIRNEDDNQILIKIYLFFKGIIISIVFFFSRRFFILFIYFLLFLLFIERFISFSHCALVMGFFLIRFLFFFYSSPLSTFEWC